MFVCAAVIGIAGQACAGTLSQDYGNATLIGDPKFSPSVGGAEIDITTGALIVTTSSFGFVPQGTGTGEWLVNGVGNAEYGIAAIHDAISEGANYANGYWNGTNGITSSAAENDPNHLTAVGYVDNSITHYTTFKGVPVNTNQTIIAYTYYGDANLDGTVNGKDQTILNRTLADGSGSVLSSFTGGPVQWLDGDFGISGNVADGNNQALLTDTEAEIAELGLPSLNYVPAGFVPAAIPEPSTLTLLGSALLGLSVVYLRRRRGAKTIVRGLMAAALAAFVTDAGAVNPLAPYGQNQGESHVGENHQGQSLVYDNISGGNVNECNFTYADLTGADLVNTSHYETDFSYAVLRGANFSGGYGANAIFVGANCTGANLSADDSYEDNFSGANLTDTTLDTYLDGAVFGGAILTGADFSGASLYETSFVDTDLSGANLAAANQLNQAIFGSTLYDSSTTFPAGFNPTAYGLTSVPEPSTLTLLAAGVVGLLGWAWRRRSRKFRT